MNAPTMVQRYRTICDLYMLKHVNCNIIDRRLLSAFVERWHEETFRLHPLIGEMTMTRGDVACLLYFSIKGHLLDRDVPLSKDEELDLMVELLEADMVEAEHQMKAINGPRACFNRLRKDFKLHLEDATTYR